jgi:hypothetical protein
MLLAPCMSCQVTVYKLIQHKTHITFQKYLYVVAIFGHVSDAATTTIIKEDSDITIEIIYVCMTRQTPSNSDFFLVCGIAFLDDGSGDHHRNMSECG